MRKGCASNQYPEGGNPLITTFLKPHTNTNLILELNIYIE